MTTLDLTHDLTPDELRAINDKLVSTLTSESVDEKILLELVSQRDEVVVAWLESLPEDERAAFARAELQANDALSKVAQSLYRDTLSQLSQLLRGRKIIKKYE